jgi:hypothetical protein
MAVESGKLATWEEALNSNAELALALQEPERAMFQRARLVIVRGRRVQHRVVVNLQDQDS